MSDGADFRTRLPRAFQASRSLGIAPGTLITLFGHERTRAHEGHYTKPLQVSYTPENARRVDCFLAIHELALEVLRSRNNILWWMRIHHAALANRRPRDLILSGDVAEMRKVEALLRAIKDRQ